MLYIKCDGKNGEVNIPCHIPIENMASLIKHAIQETGARVVTLQADGDELYEIIAALEGQTSKEKTP